MRGHQSHDHVGTMQGIQVSQELHGCQERFWRSVTQKPVAAPSCLRQRLEQHHVVAVGQPDVARFGQPFRRVEVLAHQLGHIRLRYALGQENRAVEATDHQ